MYDTGILRTTIQASHGKFVAVNRISAITTLPWSSTPGRSRPGEPQPTTTSSHPRLRREKKTPLQYLGWQHGTRERRAAMRTTPARPSPTIAGAHRSPTQNLTGSRICPFLSPHSRLSFHLLPVWYHRHRHHYFQN